MVILKITEGHISNVTVDRLDIVVLGFVSLFIIPKYAMFHSTAFQVSFCIYINKRWIRIPAWDFWEKTFAIQPHCCLCSLDVDGSQVVNTNESFYLSSTLSTRHWYHFVWERRCWRRDAGGSWIILMPTFIRTEYFLFPFCYGMEEEEEEVPAEAEEDDHEAEEFIWRMWRTDSAVSSLCWPLCSWSLYLVTISHNFLYVISTQICFVVYCNPRNLDPLPPQLSAPLLHIPEIELEWMLDCWTRHQPSGSGAKNSASRNNDNSTDYK